MRATLVFNELISYDSSSVDSYKIFFLKEKAETDCSLKDHYFNTFSKFSEKLIFLTPCYAHVRVRIRG